MCVSPFLGRINSTYLLSFNAFYGPFYCSDESSGSLQGAEAAEQEALCQAAGSAGCQHEAPEGSAGTHQQDQTVALQQGKKNSLLCKPKIVTKFCISLYLKVYVYYARVWN